MAEGMAAGGHPGTPPVRLWVRRVGVYCDEHRKTWLVAAEEEEGMLRARIQRVQVPLGEALRPSQLPPSRLPHMWQLSQGAVALGRCPCIFCTINDSLSTEMQPPLSSLNMPQKDPCQKQACEIQKCLQVNNYLESKCESVLQEMRKCCARYAKGRSICCSGFEKEEREREKLKATSGGISPSPQ